MINRSAVFGGRVFALDAALEEWHKLPICPSCRRYAELVVASSRSFPEQRSFLVSREPMGSKVALALM